MSATGGTVIDTRNLLAIIGGVILVIIGAVAASIADGVGYYILGVFNSTNIKIPGNSNFFGGLNTAIGPVFTILGVVLLVFGIVLIILALMGVFTSMKSEFNF